jgi:hypothetical protein
MKSNDTKEAKDERSRAADETSISLVRIAMAAIVFIVLALAMPIKANADLFNVSNVTELINVINLANDEVAHHGSDTIIMAPGTYTLTVEGGAGLVLPAITSEVVIYGNGSVIERSLTSAGFRIFLVRPSGNLSLYDLTVRRGLAGSVFGGGIRNEGTLTIVNSTVSDNVGVGTGPSIHRGAGIWNQGILKMVNSTVSQNFFGQAINLLGAGIGNAGVATIINSTVSGNLSSERLLPPTDIENESGGSVVLKNSVLARCGGGGSFVSLGYNLDSNGSCHLTEIGDGPNSNAGLGPLQNNGGPTETLALLPGSDAIDAGDPEGCKDFDGNVLTTDQRGFIRAVNGGSGSARCDIGAYEFNSTPVGLENIDGFVTFEPLISTYKTTAVTTGCPSGFVRKFGFDATLRNISDKPLSKLMTEVKTLTNGNLLQNADGGPGGVGAIVTLQETGEFSDGALAPGEFVDVPFTLCLKKLAPFSFFVDVLGSPQ